MCGNPTIRYAGSGTFRTGQRERWKLDCWCLHLYRYRADLWLDGRPFAIRPRHAGVIPPGVLKTYHFQQHSEHLCAHFYLPLARRADATIPALQDLGAEFEDVWSALEELVGWTATQPRRAQARLWELLWRLSEARNGSGAERARVPPYEQARRLIEQRLGRSLRVAALAEEVGLSHNHLTRLFRAHTGQTVAGYVRERRVERARHLLLHSTQAVKSIAAEVGIPDLHLFNKVIRRALGHAPRRVRADAS